MNECATCEAEDYEILRRNAERDLGERWGRWAEAITEQIDESHDNQRGEP
jgi:hypothetical protein